MPKRSTFNESATALQPFKKFKGKYILFCRDKFFIISFQCASNVIPVLGTSSNVKRREIWNSVICHELSVKKALIWFIRAYFIEHFNFNTKHVDEKLSNREKIEHLDNEKIAPIIDYRAKEIYNIFYRRENFKRAIIQGTGIESFDLKIVHIDEYDVKTSKYCVSLETSGKWELFSIDPAYLIPYLCQKEQLVIKEREFVFNVEEGGFGQKRHTFLFDKGCFDLFFRSFDASWNVQSEEVYERFLFLTMAVIKRKAEIQSEEAIALNTFKRSCLCLENYESFDTVVTKKTFVHMFSFPFKANSIHSEGTGLDIFDKAMEKGFDSQIFSRGFNDLFSRVHIDGSSFYNLANLYDLEEETMNVLASW